MMNAICMYICTESTESDTQHNDNIKCFGKIQNVTNSDALDVLARDSSIASV